MKKSFYCRFGPAILIMVIACLPFIVYGAYTGARGNENVVTDWLPPHFEETKQLEWFKERFGTAEMLAISWEGCTLENERTKELAEALRAVDLPRRSPRQQAVCQSLLRSRDVGYAFWRAVQPESSARDQTDARLVGRSDRAHVRHSAIVESRRKLSP